MTNLKSRHRVPRYRDFTQLLSFRKLVWNRRTRRLTKSLTIYDLRKIAERRTPRAPFDYADGAAEAELSLARARSVYENLEFRPHVLRDVSNVDLTTQMLGKFSSLPLGIAPTGFTRMMHTEGENAGSIAAMDAGIPFTLSTMGTRSIEDIASAAPLGRNFFQLYMWKDREKSMALVHRAQLAGFETLILTVDVPVAGDRLRDVRNGMTIPPTLTLGTIVNAISRPAWWWNFLTTDPLNFASLDSWNGTVAELIQSMFDPTVSFEDLKWIRSQWQGGLIVKGIQRVDDAVMAVEAGADAVILSNHGGRQLDRAPIPVLLLPEVISQVGNRAEVHVDTGIMHGADIIAAIAAGASFTWIGRAYLYGLMAGGKEGVDRSIAILRGQMVRTMQLLGARTLDDLNPDHVSFMRHGRIFSE